MKALLLDQFYAPVDLIDWQKAVTLLLTGKAEAIEDTDRVIRSPSTHIKVPRVLRLIRAKARRLQAAFSKKAVMIRDNNTCCYCHKVFNPKVLTLDHVIPRCQGGSHGWTNVVTACQKCNFHKGGRTPKQASMQMGYQPRMPLRMELLQVVIKEFGEWGHTKNKSQS